MECKNKPILRVLNCSQFNVFYCFFYTLVSDFKQMESPERQGPSSIVSYRRPMDPLNIVRYNKTKTDENISSFRSSKFECPKFALLILLYMSQNLYNVEDDSDRVER
jgi:hypothetical protein